MITDVSFFQSAALARTWFKPTASCLPHHAALVLAVDVEVKPPVSPVKAHVVDVGDTDVPAALVSIDGLGVSIGEPGRCAALVAVVLPTRCVKYIHLNELQFGATQSVMATNASAATLAAKAATTPRMSRRI